MWDNFGFNDINVEAVDSFGDFGALSQQVVPSFGNWDWSFPSAVDAPVSATDWNFDSAWLSTPTPDSISFIQAPPITITEGRNLLNEAAAFGAAPAGESASWFSFGGARQFLDSVGSFTRDVTTAVRVFDDAKDRVSELPRNVTRAVEQSRLVQSRPVARVPQSSIGGGGGSSLAMVALLLVGGVLLARGAK